AATAGGGFLPLPDVLPAAGVVVAVHRLAGARLLHLQRLWLQPQRHRPADGALEPRLGAAEDGFARLSADRRRTVHHPPPRGARPVARPGGRRGGGGAPTVAPRIDP